MPRRDEESSRLHPTVAAQIEAVNRALDGNGNGIEVGVAETDDGGVDFLYQKGAILVREEYRDRVKNFLGISNGVDVKSRRRSRGKQAPDPAPPPHEQEHVVVEGVALLPIPTDRERTTLRQLDDLDAEFGESIATPNHFFSLAQPPPPTATPVGPCPATEPEEVPSGIEPDPPPCSGSDGEGVRIYVADNGLLPDAANKFPWLAGVEGELESEDTTPRPPDISADTYSGHGTFVAGVIRCTAPATEVFVDDVFKKGTQLESEAIPRLLKALRKGVDIVNLSVAAPCRKDIRPLTFERAQRELRSFKGTVFVVPAGNNGTRRPHWPGAFPNMVSVGALTADERARAGFSNFGAWVDVYARGRGLVNAYAEGRYTCIEPPYKDRNEVRYFYGMARWSGTSFSTPIVSGLIAARMSRTGENGPQAAAALIAMAQAQAIPGVGAILRPCLDDNHG